VRYGVRPHHSSHLDSPKSHVVRQVLIYDQLQGGAFPKAGRDSSIRHLQRMHRGCVCPWSRWKRDLQVHFPVGVWTYPTPDATHPHGIQNGCIGAVSARGQAGSMTYRSHFIYRMGGGPSLLPIRDDIQAPATHHQGYQSFSQNLPDRECRLRSYSRPRLLLTPRPPVYTNASEVQSIQERGRAVSVIGRLLIYV
jgi:hypothetical protein